MRKIIPLILSLALVLALAACGSNDTTSEATTGTTAAEDTSTPTEVTITGLNGNGEPTDLTVPYDPQRIAILDMASLDILDALGLVSKVVEDRPALIPAGLELARVIAAKDPMAVRLTKEAMRANVDAAGFDNALQVENRNQTLMIAHNVNKDASQDPIGKYWIEDRTDPMNPKGAN